MGVAIYIEGSRMPKDSITKNLLSIAVFPPFEDARKIIFAEC